MSKAIKGSIIFVFGLLGLLYVLGKISQSEEIPLPETMVDNPNNPAIDYGWDRGIYIYASDTNTLMKDPFRATWIPKQKFKWKQLPPPDSAYIKQQWKNEMAVEEMGDDIREYYDR